MRAAMAAMAVTAMVLVGVTACEPAPTVTITATTPDRYTEACGFFTIEGRITPAKATSGVVLQRTVNGKWEDWIWYQTGDTDEEPHRIRGHLDYTSFDWTGYWLEAFTPCTVGRTYSLRVRSAGGSVVSNTVWITTT